MEIRAELGMIRVWVLGEIEMAARKGNTSRLIELTELVRSLEADDRAMTALEQRIELYRNAVNGSGTPNLQQAPNPPVTQPISPKRRGKETRERFAKERSLIPEKGALHRTRSGARIGVATATETRPDIWFLGLPDLSLDAAALLCDREGKRLDFILPRNVIEEVWPLLSRSPGQVKFNVIRRDGRYQLQIPGRAPLDLTGFRGNYGPLS